MNGRPAVPLQQKGLVFRGDGLFLADDGRLVITTYVSGTEGAVMDRATGCYALLTARNGSARIGRVLFLTACWRPLTIPSASAYLLLMATRNSISSPAAPSLKFSRTNALLAVAALAAISLGYFLLDQGSITAAPVLLVLGYVVLLPLAIIV